MTLFVRTYRKREPIEVQAALVVAENIDAVANWCNGQVRTEKDICDPWLDTNKPAGIKLLTKNRLQFARIGDYIYKDHEDYFHVVSQGPFHFEYEPVQDPPKENNL